MNLESKRDEIKNNLKEIRKNINSNSKLNTELSGRDESKKESNIFKQNIELIKIFNTNSRKIISNKIIM